MFVEPLRDLVVIKRIKTETKFSGTSILIANADKQEVLPQGIVQQVGPGRFLENGELLAMTVKVGDKVLFTPQSGHPVKLSNAMDNDDTIVMPENEIIGVIKL
jgi:chaperonin GroES